jgi:hypothetical protein
MTRAKQKKLVQRGVYKNAQKKASCGLFFLKISLLRCTERVSVSESRLTPLLIRNEYASLKQQFPKFEKSGFFLSLGFGPGFLTNTF